MKDGNLHKTYLSIGNPGFSAQFYARHFGMACMFTFNPVWAVPEYNKPWVSPTAIHIQSPWDFNIRKIALFRLLKNNKKLWVRKSLFNSRWQTPVRKPASNKA